MELPGAAASNKIQANADLCSPLKALREQERKARQELCQIPCVRNRANFAKPSMRKRQQVDVECLLNFLEENV
jgi:hypothetical protein